MATRLLMIDPDITFMINVRQALEETGEFEVSISANGMAAQDALLRRRYDVAVIDFNVPDIETAELITLLRQVQPNLPIIMCPRTASHQERVRYLEIQGAIQKPYLARDLIPYIRSVLTRENARREQAAREFAPPEMPKTLRSLVKQDPAEPAFPQGTDLLAKIDAFEQEEVEGDTEPIRSRPSEPPRDAQKSPAFADHDLPSVRQLLETEPLSPDSTEFGEVLDAVAQSPLTEATRSEVDRAFRELVDSMRTPASPRSTLEDLLNSIAADAAQQTPKVASTDEALDFVLDAIRRGASPHDDPGELETFDDRTIGDVLSDLFDPSFEGVLAALAGEEIDEKTFEEPSYDEADYEERDLGPSERDQYGYEEARSEWGTRHPEMEPPGSLPEEDRGPVIEEPPVSSEDSSHYPATAALNAITSLDKENFSLNLLLEQIEQQLPPPKSKQSRLKPWKKDDESPEGALQLEAMFDRFEGQAPAARIPEPDHTREDTRPSKAMLDEIEQTPVQDTDTAPTNLELLDMAWPGQEFYENSEQIRAAAETDEEAIAEAFYAGIQHPETVEDEVYDDVPDEEHLIAVPVGSLTAKLLEEEELPAAANDDQIAQIAVQLTQFALESSAQATLLGRPGQLLAQAGELSAPVMERLFEAVDSAWHTSPPESGALARYIRLPEIGEFLVYSTYVMEDLILSMAFHANTSMRTMRRQARRLSESLAFVPESDESEAASTLPSRPTDLRPPAGLREAVQEPEVIQEEAVIEEVEAVEEKAPPPRPEGPYAAYTCLWVPNDPGLEILGDYAEELYYWIGDIAEENAWDIENLAVRPDYVLLSLHVPHKTLPDSVVSLLMEETAYRSAQFYPDVVRDPAMLWADGYYVVTPPRDLTDREIARFITYQRQAQID